MRNRSPVTLFPFLSVLISAMGVLAFLAVMFSMLPSARAPKQSEVQHPTLEIQWTGAPSHVRPVLVECRRDGVVLHYRVGASARKFAQAELRKEAEVLRELMEQGLSKLGAASDRQELWQNTVSLMRSDRRMANSFALAMHEIELDNAEAQSRPVIHTRFPILLVYTDGVEVYDVVSYILETATRLPVGLEPMLEGWGLPYLKYAS